MSVNKVFKGAGILRDKKVAVIGVGGVGCVVAELLARMKIRIILIDNDIVDDANLERQILFGSKDLLKPKVVAAKEKLQDFTSVESINEELTEKNIGKYIHEIDLVIDCTDNVETRLLINRYCYDNNIPWLYTGAVGNIGIVYFIAKGKPCYECINQEKKGDTSCEIGVLNTIVTIVGAIAANIAIKFLIEGIGEAEIIRISDNNISRLKAKKNPGCKVCS